MGKAVEFLVHRPVSVTMVYLALVIIGCVFFAKLPVSLMPAIPIPHITVDISSAGTSARELESSVTTPLRRQLMQMADLVDIKSETRDESATIGLTMEYGVDTDLAYIEVNEKIDAAMNTLPKSLERPKAIKSTDSDIPAVYLNVFVKNGDKSLTDISDVADNELRRRIEQLPEVALVDMTGMPAKELRLIPDYELMQAARVDVSDIEQALQGANSQPGSLSVKDGYYEYNIHMAGGLQGPEDVRHTSFKKNGHVHTVGDFCSVELFETEPQGYSTYNGHRSITMAVIKQSEASMHDFAKAMDNTIGYFSQQYPDIEFVLSRSQSHLLDAAISGLGQNLISGIVLMFAICFIFMRSWKLPIVIGITVTVAMIMTFLAFYLCHISINIISLAGLILAIGMMIDNSVIVAENISQYRRRTVSLTQSCAEGTAEMITPMLSSSLTTVAIFLPLVFMSGIAGAVFTDQALSISIGLGCSYVASITLLPVLYSIFFMNVSPPEANRVDLRSIPNLYYNRGIDWIFRHKIITICCVLLSIAAIYPLLRQLDTERMPRIDTSETVLQVDWNENINADENLRRTAELESVKRDTIAERSAFIAHQDFILGDEAGMGSSQTKLYFHTDNPEALDSLRLLLGEWIEHKYPDADYEFATPANVFEKVFSSSEPPLEARIPSTGSYSWTTAEEISKKASETLETTPIKIPVSRQTDLTIDPELLLLYGIDRSEITATLRQSLTGKNITILHSANAFLPVRIRGTEGSLERIISKTQIKSRPDAEGNVHYYPLGALIHPIPMRDLRTITADRAGEYIPLQFSVKDSEVFRAMDIIRKAAATQSINDVKFTGAVFSNTKMLRELIGILLVSLLMMYFILCAQFESFLQPLVVLIEIPVDISFALLSLWLCGQTLNLMSAIGIIVTCGIVVNDSILKLDAINELRRKGVPLYKAIHIAGERRLRPILMTSFTTILAMTPVLFTSDMGSELQRPLAIALIGSMTIGTLVSIFIIPMVYYLIYGKKQAYA